MTQKIATQPDPIALPPLPKPPYEGDEILGELYAVKLNLNREANYDVSVLLKEARRDAKNRKRGQVPILFV
jgi:hypothetical protein